MNDAGISANDFVLRSVYIRDSSLRMKENFDPLIPGQQLKGGFRHKNVRLIFSSLAVETNKRTYTFSIKFEFRYKNASSAFDFDDGDFLVDICAEIAVAYEMKAGYEPGDSELLRWAGVNGLMHAWPYWREYCHSSMLKMNIPHVVMPMLQVSPASSDVGSVSVAKNQRKKKR